MEEDEVSSKRFLFEESKKVIYDSVTEDDICMYFDDEYRYLILNLLNNNMVKYEKLYN